MIKLIATDLDGTLLNNNGEFHQALNDTIIKLSNKNIIFCAASGRLYGTLKRNFKDIQAKVLFICHNGALIQYSDTNSSIFERILDKMLVIELLDFLNSLNVEIYLCDKESAYLKKPSKKIMEKFIECDVSVEEIDALQLQSSNIYRIGIFQPNGIENHIIEKLELKFGNRISLQRGGKIWLDIVSNGISKGIALKIIQDRFKICKEETMVFGDYYNDTPMFSEALYCYAMSNAPKDVKEKANFIAPSNEENGVIQVIKKEVLNNTF